MSNNVFANGNELACKAGSGKSIACFPDVCMTPPENPATPPGVPVPYPNTAKASDTAKGSKSVKISNKEVMLKNKSHFKKSMGNEAGSAAKKGVVTSVNRGKVYFAAWSMDVKIEGKNAVRHLDMTTHNHPSVTPNAGTTVFLDSMTTATQPDECKEAAKQQRAAQRALPPAKKRAGHVTAGAHFKPGGQTFKASSNVSASDISRSPGTFEGFSPGVPPRHATPPGVSNVECGGKKHVYKNSGSSPTGDAEAKIIEDLFASNGGKPPKGTLYLKVVGAPVCCDCQALMKCASESIKIVICPPARRDECDS